jgi:hypothetical protein
MVKTTSIYIYYKSKDSVENFIKAKRRKQKVFRQMAFFETPRSIALLWGCAGKACSEVEAGFPHLLTQIGTPLCPLQFLA